MPRFPTVALSLVLACLTSIVRAQPQRAAAEPGIDPWIAAHQRRLHKALHALALTPGAFVSRGRDGGADR